MGLAFRMPVVRAPRPVEGGSAHLRWRTETTQKHAVLDSLRLMQALLRFLGGDTLDILGVLLLCAVLLKARPVATEGEAASAKHFVRGLAGRAVLLICCVACLNLLVNPFGPYASRLFEPIVLSSRQKKLDLFERLRSAPAIVLLGSSRSFTMEPAYIEARASRTAFNASVQGGEARDYLAFGRYLAARRSFPELFIVGLGVEQGLFRSAPVEPRDPWGKYLGREESLGSRLVQTYKGLFTIEELRASLRVLARELWGGPPAPYYRFDPDGLTHYYGPQQPLPQAVDEALAGSWRPSVFAPETLREEPVAEMQQFLELSRQRGTRVIVYLPPYQPRALDRYLKESHFGSLRAQLLGQLATWTKQYPVRFHDFTDVSGFGGNADMFYDASHPREDACRLMVDAMLADLN